MNRISDRSAAKFGLIDAVAGGTLGGYSAANNGGDISQGVLFGTAIGAAAGSLGGYVNSFSPVNNFYQITSAQQLGYWLTVKGTVGFVTNFGYGAIEGYAGGKGNIGTVLQSAALNGAAGIVTTPVGEIFSDTLTNGADYFFGKGGSYEVVD